MRELPRKLSVDELAELFEGRTPLVHALAAVDDPLGHADAVIAGLSHEDKVDALNAHPAIGASHLSPRSAGELAHLNRVYEEKFGFRFVVHVAGRPKREILEVLRERIGRTEAEELDTGCRELVAIARDRRERT